MNPDKFREIREAADGNLLDAAKLFKGKAIKESKKKIKLGMGLIKELSEGASGEIQERSVFNLNVRADHITKDVEEALAKLKPGKKK